MECDVDSEWSGQSIIVGSVEPGEKPKTVLIPKCLTITPAPALHHNQQHQQQKLLASSASVSSGMHVSSFTLAPSILATTRTAISPNVITITPTNSTSQTLSSSSFIQAPSIMPSSSASSSVSQNSCSNLKQLHKHHHHHHSLRRQVVPRILVKSKTPPSSQTGSNNQTTSSTMRDVLASIPEFSVKPKRRTNKKMSTAAQLEQTREGCIDLETPDSILVGTNLRALLNKHTFSILPPLFQYKLIQLLPKVDRPTVQPELDDIASGSIRLSSSSLNNEFFARACLEWRERLSEGEFTPENQMKLKLEMEREKGKLDPWKLKHFEPFWGCDKEQPKKIHKTKLKEHLRQSQEILELVKQRPSLKTTIKLRPTASITTSTTGDVSHQHLRKTEVPLKMNGKNCDHLEDTLQLSPTPKRTVGAVTRSSTCGTPTIYQLQPEIVHSPSKMISVPALLPIRTKIVKIEPNCNSVNSAAAIAKTEISHPAQLEVKLVTSLKRSSPPASEGNPLNHTRSDFVDCTSNKLMKCNVGLEKDTISIEPVVTNPSFSVHPSFDSNHQHQETINLNAFLDQMKNAKAPEPELGSFQTAQDTSSRSPFEMHVFHGQTSVQMTTPTSRKSEDSPLEDGICSEPNDVSVILDDGDSSIIDDRLKEDELVLSPDLVVGNVVDVVSSEIRIPEEEVVANVEELEPTIQNIPIDTDDPIDENFTDAENYVLESGEIGAASTSAGPGSQEKQLLCSGDEIQENLFVAAVASVLDSSSDIPASDSLVLPEPQRLDVNCFLQVPSDQQMWPLNDVVQQPDHFTNSSNSASSHSSSSSCSNEQDDNANSFLHVASPSASLISSQIKGDTGMLSGGSEAEVSSTVMLNSHNIHTEDAFSAGSLGDLHPNGNDGQTHPQTQAAVSSSGNSIPVNAVPIVSYSGTPDMNSVPHQQNQFQGNSMFLSQTATVVTPVMVSSNMSGYDQGLNQLVPASVIVNTQPRATEGIKAIQPIPGNAVPQQPPQNNLPPGSFVPSFSGTVNQPRVQGTVPVRMKTASVPGQPKPPAGGRGSRSHSNKPPPGAVNLERSYQICQAVIQNSPNRHQLRCQLRPLPSLIAAQANTNSNSSTSSNTSSSSSGSTTGSSSFSISGKEDTQSASVTSTNRMQQQQTNNAASVKTTTQMDGQYVLVQRYKNNNKVPESQLNVPRASSAPPGQQIQPTQQQPSTIHATNGMSIKSSGRGRPASVEMESQSSENQHPLQQQQLQQLSKRVALKGCGAMTTYDVSVHQQNFDSSQPNNCPCSLNALVICQKCGAFCHDGCLSSSNLCVSCVMIR